MFDICIKNGYIIDGTGAAACAGDIYIKDDKIAEIGGADHKHFDADIVLDADGKTVAPGFIDMHTHSDYTLAAFPSAENYLRQGVTTQLTGNCGFSLAPICEKNKDHLTGFLGIGVDKNKINWHTFGQYLDDLRSRPIAQNIAALVGHNAIRTAVMGLEDRRAKDSEIQQMKEIVTDSMQAGAWGMSTGIGYTPCCNVETKELIELCKVVKQFDGIYTTHARCGPKGGAPYPAYGIEEAIEIARKTGVKVQVSHIMSHIPLMNKSEELLQMIDTARLEGIEITFDQIPYAWCPGPLGHSAFPEWFLQGGLAKFTERLNDPQLCQKVKDQIKPETPSWEETIITYSQSAPDMMGKNITEIAELKNTDPQSVVMDMVRRELSAYGQDIKVLVKISAEVDLAKIFAHPASMIGSDGIALADYGPTAKESFPNPANYGAFPRMFKKYVREDKVLSLTEAVRKMTSLPAQTLGITDRGLIKKNMYADIVIFDSSKIADKDIFNDRSVHPEGVMSVIINGRLALNDGKFTGQLPGKVL